MGHYEFRVMPFGLCNAPSTFQATMNELLKPFLRKFLIVFFDDILVYSTTWDAHLNHLERTFQTLLQGQFFLKGSKCLLAQQQLEYLGHIVSAQGVAADPSKIQAMVQWPSPMSLKALHGFLGLTGFYRRFIKGYASIAAPLTTLLKKDGFNWCPAAQSAFDQLKKAMTKAPVLALPNFTLPFQLETDASGSAMGVVLMQQDHPIAFFSKPFYPRLLHSSTYVRELHAITSAMKKWRQYLLGYPFVILTDHRSLKLLMSHLIQTPEQQYRAGKHNVVADALSRPTDIVQSHFFILSMPRFIFLDKLRQSLQDSPDFVSLLAKVRRDPASFHLYSIHNDLLLYDGKIWLNHDNPFIRLLLEEYHTTPLGGHMGLYKTMARIQGNFFWKGMRSIVHTFVSQCSTCQHTKYETQKPAGLLQPIPLPHDTWEDLSLDFITGLPPSLGHYVILMVVDHFSKDAHFGTLPTHFTAFKVARLFMDMVCKHHGIPRSLVSDRDPIFISRF
ncbi:hypothetical protein V8G54_023651 [Vigna mungo]|uniref:Uncharacterized protein n=1 Tax=Vigna mungo TaxID=3915 RepID=A0AAQ3N5L8_VIGMU